MATATLATVAVAWLAAWEKACANFLLTSEPFEPSFFSCAIEFCGFVFFKVTEKFTDSPAFVDDVFATSSRLRVLVWTVMFTSRTPDTVTSSLFFASVTATMLCWNTVWLKVAAVRPRRFMEDGTFISQLSGSVNGWERSPRAMLLSFSVSYANRLRPAFTEIENCPADGFACRLSKILAV